MSFHSPQTTQVISATLVSVHSIREMQEQNVRLRQVVRELSAQREAEEKQRAEEESRVIAEKVESYQKELEELRAARERQAQRVELLVKQVKLHTHTHARMHAACL